jgi:cell division septation protein DedD
MADDPPASSGSSFWKTLPGILTGLATLLTAIVAVLGLFLPRDDSPPPRVEPTATGPGPARTSPSTEPDRPRGWPGGSAYTVILSSSSADARARAIQRRASDGGLDAGVLRSSDFASLRPGFWVVFSGAFKQVDDARERQSRARALGFPQAYTRFVSP